MGFRISWLAAKGLSKARLLAEFGLVDSGIADEANEAPFSVAELPTGWALLWSNDPTFATIERAAKLSRLAPVVNCWVNETAMFSMASYFEQDRHIWFVGHDFQRGADNLAHEGEMPEDFEAIRRELLAKQAEHGDKEPAVDFLFDIPVELARSVCGFRHDDWSETNRAFTRGEPAPEKPKGMLARLLGR
jgi:hypothetical protein